jgi:hypothetical protein
MGMTKLVKMKHKLSDLKDEDKRVKDFASNRWVINSSIVLSFLT